MKELIITRDLLDRLIKELKLAQQDHFCIGTDNLITEAENLIKEQD